MYQGSIMKLEVKSTVIHEDGTATVTLLLRNPSFYHNYSLANVTLKRNRANPQIWEAYGNCPESWVGALLLKEVDAARLTYDEILSVAITACEEVES